MIVILLYTRTAVLLDDLSTCFGVTVTEIPEFIRINGKIWFPFECNGDASDVTVSVERFKSYERTWNNFANRISWFALYNKNRFGHAHDMYRRFFWFAFQVGMGYTLINYKQIHLWPWFTKAMVDIWGIKPYMDGLSKIL
jgi:hypothetical protein